MRASHLPCASSCLLTPVLAAGAFSYRGTNDHASVWDFSAYVGGASSRSTRRLWAASCLDGRQLHPPLGAEEFERPERALVGHLAGVGDPVAQVDVRQST